MELDIYCDESNQELLSSNRDSINKYFLIGGVWLPSSKRGLYKQIIGNIKKEEQTFGEAKWNKVSPSRLSFYLKLIDFFFNQGEELRFRCIVIDSKKVDLARYHDADQELGFYKFCYQLLKNWIEDFNSYSIFTDCKTNRMRNRLPVLERHLRQANLLAKIHKLQNVESKESVLLQLADVILGAVAAKFNSSTSSEAKLAVLNSIEEHLGHKIIPTSRSVKKFNIFKIQLSGDFG